ncbi:MAG: type II toxin-antitoxin system RelE/ParE family toxin [Alphaproteobacteria bacterium]|nr:type II toxin-antitoxin system RelE/ParE family toxin [Alphaproteobacteria bacterium]
MRFRFSRVAEADIESIGDHIAADNPTRALSFIRDLRSRCRNLCLFPEAAPLRPDIGQDIRLAMFGLYRILYVVRADELEICRVLHGARDIAPDAT